MLKGFLFPEEIPVSRRALTLPEIIVVLLIVGTSMLPVYSIFSYLFRGTSLTIDEIKGTNYASELMEAIQCQPYDRIPVTESPVRLSELRESAPEFCNSLGVTPDVEGFERYVQIREIEDFVDVPTGNSSRCGPHVLEKISSFNRARLIKVTVKWKVGNAERSATLVTLKTPFSAGGVGYR